MLIKLNNAKLYKYSNQFCTLIIFVLIIEYLNYTSNHRRSRLKREIPLLDQAIYYQHSMLQCYNCYSFQDLNRDFMSDNVWISMSFCYSSSLGPRDNHKASVSAVMSARLFGERSGMSEGFSPFSPCLLNDSFVSGANVVLQVFNDTEIAKGDLKVLGLIEKYERSHLVWAAPSPEPLCDCALGHSLGRLLAHRLPSLRDKISEDSVIVISHVGAFLSKPYIFNVLQSPHQTWFFRSEAPFYLDQSWETTFTAMTARRWRQITDEASSCSELVSKQNVVLSKLYFPPWKQAQDANSSDTEQTSSTNIDIMQGVAAAEKFITNR